MRPTARLASVPLLLAASLYAQRQPETAHVFMYFPQLADGGPVAGQWQTTFTFVNVGPSPARVRLNIYGDNGRPLALDLGLGLASQHDILIPAGGVRTLRSRIASTTIVSGWAIATSTVPVQATVAFRTLLNGIPRQEITAQPTLPSLDFASAANRFLGVAVANAYSNSSISVDLSFIVDGVLAGGPVRITIPPFGHTSFNLGDKIPGIGDRQGVLSIGAVTRPFDSFVAWTLNSDASNTLSSLPPGGYSWPISHYHRVRLVFQQVVDAALRSGILTTAPELQVLTDQSANAFARAGSTVAVSLGLSQLISDSPSELAFAVGHELGHIYQQRTGRLDFVPTNAEFDADIWGALLSLLAAYDPYAAAGTLAKLSMATGTSGLISQFEEQHAPDAHKSFNSRLESIFGTLVLVCNFTPEIQKACSDYKSIAHPNLPDIAPLVTTPPVR